MGSAMTSRPSQGTVAAGGMDALIAMKKSPTEHLSRTENSSLDIGGLRPRAKWLEEHSGFRVKQVWGCDQEAMRYVWGAHKLGSPFTSEGRKLNEKVDQTKLLNGVASGKFTGALEVDIEFPDSHYNYFEEFSALFITAEIKVEDLSPEQRESLPEKLKSKV